MNSSRTMFMRGYSDDIITIPSSAESDGNSTSVSCFIINKSNFLAYQWGTLDYQEEVVVRPEFKGTEYRTCTITPTRKFDAMLANHLASGDHYILQLLC